VQANWRSEEHNGQRCELRMKTRRTLVRGMRNCLSERSYDLGRSDLHAYFQHWDLSQEDQEFSCRPPGQVQMSRHPIEYARYYGPQPTWRHRTMTYANAAESLVVGYQNGRRRDQWRMAIKRAIGPASKYF
jgi:hypothetical protein